ncbi:MAG: hypothetical protein VXZ82_05625 [Planctomycetota bacterium]|nr:hypothetical protein [Planctomycetota bacterium]
MRASVHCILVLCVSGLCCLTSKQAADAQTVRVTADTESTHFVGVPLSFEIVISDVSMFADANCEFRGKASSDITVRQGRVSKQSFNGVGSIRYGFECISAKQGKVEVGPFKVSVGDQEVEIKPIVFEFGEVPADPNMTLSLKLPNSRIYVGQRVPLEVEWAIYGESNNEVNHAFNRLEIRSRFFDMFEFTDTPRTRRDQLTLRIATKRGAAELVADQKIEERNGKNFLVVTAKRSFTPDKSGVFEDIQLFCNSQRATQFRNAGFAFSSRYEPVNPKPISAASSPLLLEVLPIPTARRPAGFGGAVGESFAIQAATNRSIVRVGDPISLDLTVSGVGNLTEVSIPLTGESAILDREYFDVPNEPPTGNLAAGTKQFKIPIRVTDESITEIPPIPLSWFNPVKEEFETIYTKPIALQVKEAQMLDNSTIVSTQPTTPEERPQADEKTKKSRNAVQLNAANLAIQTDPTLLLAASGVFHFGTLHWVFYGASIALILTAFVYRKMGTKDPERSQSKSLSRQTQAQIDSALSAEPAQGLSDIAEALRKWIAENPEGPRDSLEQLISQCEELRFASSAIDSSRVNAIASEAKESIRSLEARR